MPPPPIIGAFLTIVAVVPWGPGDFSETTSGGTPAIGCSVNGRSFASFSLYGWPTEGIDTLDLKEARALLAAFGRKRYPFGIPDADLGIKVLPSATCKVTTSPESLAITSTVLLEKRTTTETDVRSLFPLAPFSNGCLNFMRFFTLELHAMSQNVPSLNRVLATAALASLIVGLLMSYQWSRAAEPPVTKVIRLHALISHR
jgi:hypothetical protein